MELTGKEQQHEFRFVYAYNEDVTKKCAKR